MKRVAMPITFAIAFFIGTVFSHPNAWFMSATETVSPSPGGEGRGEGGLQTKIKLHFRIFRPALTGGRELRRRPAAAQLPILTRQSFTRQFVSQSHHRFALTIFPMSPRRGLPPAGAL